MRRLLTFLAPYKGLVFLNLLCNALMSVFMVVSIPIIIPFLNILFEREAMTATRPAWSWGMASMVEYGKWGSAELIRQHGKETALLIVCAVMVAIFFLKNLFRYLAMFFIAPIRTGVVRDIRRALFDKALALPLSFFSEERKGDLMSRMVADVGEIEWSIFNVLETVVREPIVILGSLAFMVYVSPPLTLFILVLIAVTVFIVGGIGRSLKRQSHKAQARLGLLTSLIEEALGGLRVIKAFNAEGYQREKFERENNDLRGLLTRIWWRRDLASPMSEFLGVTMVGILLWYGSRQVFGGTLEPETFFAFLYAFFNIINPAKNFSSAAYNIQKGMAAVERVDKILSAEENRGERREVRGERVEARSERREARGEVNFEKSIEFKNVGFAYRERETKVLEGINLVLPKGKIVALVGPSGAGKTTMADLLPRFFEVTDGEILLDGKNTKNLPLNDLRSIFAVVSQEPVLFNDTIWNNITFGQEGVSEEVIVAAAKAANAHDFILATENGYQTNIGDRGLKLSGGQRQRLTIARAVLKNRPILILDEATSALDSESERLVQEALARLMEGRTTLVIAHRLSTIQHADEIVVMERGRIIERGTHEQLMQASRVYRKMVELQAF